MFTVEVTGLSRRPGARGVEAVTLGVAPPKSVVMSAHRAPRFHPSR